MTPFLLCLCLGATPPSPHGSFQELAPGIVRPEGWLKAYLERQRDGLTGHLDEVAGYPFNTVGWAAASIQQDKTALSNWWPYEQTGYWVDGMLRCGHVLGDSFLLEKARKSLRYVLDHPAADGFLGPELLRKVKREQRWPFVVFFRAMKAEYEATGDKRIPEALRRHYLADLDKHPYTDLRDAANLEHLLWVAKATGDARLLTAAERLYAASNQAHPRNSASTQGFLNREEHIDRHGVTYHEFAKLGAILYLATGKQAYLRDSVEAYRKLEMQAMLPGGVPSSTEEIRGRDPLDAHEVCDTSTHTWSCGYLLQATGDAAYGDALEKACFNAAPGAVTADFKAMQYFSCANQVLATGTSNHQAFFCGNTAAQFTSNPWVKCCPGEVNRAMPNFVSRMWMGAPGGGLAATLYGPCRVTVPVGAKGQKVTVVEETGYPFTESITFRIEAASPVAFPLQLRIPAWCAEARLSVNGEAQNLALPQGTFVTLARTFRPGDRIHLDLPQRPRLRTWPRHGVSVELGPLAFSLKIDEVKTKDDNPGETPAPGQLRWNLSAGSPWAYALDLRFGRLDDQLQVVRHPVTDQPWTPGSAQVELKVPARRVKGWELEHRTEVLRDDSSEAAWVKGNFTFMPQLPEGEDLLRRLAPEKETITLVPYGCTRLRLTVFPHSPYEVITRK